MRWIIAYGNVVEGFTFCGPFYREEEAVAYSESVGDDCCITELTEPDPEVNIRRER